MISKPAHLGPRYAAQFEDESVARAYHTRPPYPAELFEILEGLMPAGPRSVLDLGCGTGDLALGLLGGSDRIDAVDPSGAMLDVARTRAPTEDGRLRWVRSSAEAFRPETRYSLIVAAESLHWMEWSDVFGWIPDALLPGAFLCLVSGRELRPVPWQKELGELIRANSTNREFRPYDLVSEITSRGLFLEVGRRTTTPVPCAQTIGEYVESFHTRNGLSRERMTEAAARAFDAALHGLVASQGSNGRIRGLTQATAVWGRPSHPRCD